MSRLEKCYAAFAIIFGVALIIALLTFPELRSLFLLIPLCLVGMLINIGLLFVVLRDIFLRRFASETTKYIWIAVVFLFWPSILYYLPKHGFKPR